MSAILTSLSPELLVHILGLLSSPRDLYSAIAASSRLYRTFTAYRHSVTSAVLQEAIPPEIECDFLLAFRAQAVWKHVPEGNDKAEIDSSQDHLDGLDQESTAVLDESRAGRTKEIYNLVPDSGRSPRLWNFYRKFEHFIQLYSARALSTLQQSSLDSDESKLQLSLSEETRLKRAFFRCEVYTCLFQISQTTHEDTRDEAPHTDPGPAYIETYPPWEIEEIACIVHFYTNLIQELCERIEDDFITSVREKETKCASPVHGNEENRLSTWLDYHSIDWYSESSKRHLRQTHIDYLVSRGMLAVWKLTHAPGPSQTVRKMVVTTHFTSNDVPSIMFQLQRATSIVKSDQTNSRTRSPGWAWASEAMTPYHRLRAAAHSGYNLRNQGYVFGTENGCLNTTSSRLLGVR